MALQEMDSAAARPDPVTFSTVMSACDKAAAAWASLCGDLGVL